jgi:hypothetical protein
MSSSRNTDFFDSRNMQRGMEVLSLKLVVVTAIVPVRELVLAHDLVAQHHLLDVDLLPGGG